MRFDIITIFPKIFDSYFDESILKRAQKKKLIKIGVHNLRDFTKDKHRKVDDRPFGGGAGMIFKVEPIYNCVNAIKKLKTKSGKRKTTAKSAKRRERIILFSAKGKTMNQSDVRRWAKYDQLILICGRYEGVDERVAKHIADEEVSVGNYVLTGGEIPAMIVVDAVSRLIPGVLGKKESLKEESFSGCLRTTAHRLPQRNHKAVVGSLRQSDSEASSRLAVSSYLEYPQYTRPEEFREWKAPEVLLSGNHEKIKEWKEKMSKK